MEDSANAILVKSKTGEEKFAACVLLANTRPGQYPIKRNRSGPVQFDRIKLPAISRGEHLYPIHWNRLRDSNGSDDALDVNKVVRKKLGARKVSFADPEDTRRITGMELGGVTPPGLPADLPLWVDARVMERPFVILGAGTRSAKIKVTPDYFLTLPQAEVVAGLAKETG
ncbi:MAG: hypothetical protein IMF08_05985 [Proteobacteria bacterium]|nr:hypothetical protein [Pseudomonadota bacterium]